MRTESKKDKNQKLLMSLGGLALVLIIATIVVVKINDNARAYELEQLEQQKLQQKYEEARLAEIERLQEEEAKREEEKAAEEVSQQTGFIGGIQYDTMLTPGSTEEQVMEVMHKMTHQKVRAERKIGAIPMVEDTIIQVYNIVSNSDFGNKEKMLEIAGKWKNGWFDTIDYDHNFFWKHQEGEVGKAYGVMTSVEEQEFIKNNFPEYVQE
jgi:CBS domain-containing protein